MADRRLKFWGWGYETERLTSDEVARLESAYALRFGVSGFDVTPPPREEDIALRAPRVKAPAALATLCSTSHYDRLLHSYGKSFFDSAPLRATSPTRPTWLPSHATRTTSSRPWTGAIRFAP
jgi:alkyldihydroxyacetonephosphate synthase